MESDLTDLKTSKVLYDKCACLWTNGNLIERHLQSVAPEEIERIVSSCFGSNEELLLHLNGADYCGFLRIPNYSAINYAFNKRIDTNGILEISDGLVTKLLSLDYYQDVDGHWVADVEICH